jgi:hypothetical protein
MIQNVLNISLIIYLIYTLMKYLKKFNESLEEDWDLEEIGDIFQDIIDEGFSIKDVHIGSSLTIAPKLWCNSAEVFRHQDFSGKQIPSLSISFTSVYKNTQYDFSILDVLDESIKHFESYYKVKLESIYTVGIPTIDYSPSGVRKIVNYNWFSSCETIKDIVKRTMSANSKGILPLTRFDLTFDLSK